ncbi:MAG: lantibiotic dehydratase family protein [Acidobacteria bacterium]|nr:lantibiotic dehydratase family protein [Acidobacteriota bacterium]
MTIYNKEFFAAIGKSAPADATAGANMFSNSTVVPVSAKSGLSEHLIELDGGEWALWKNVGLRGAGFPARQVLGLASPEGAAAADQILDGEEKMRLALDESRDAFLEALDELRREGQWDDKKRRNNLLNALRQLKSGKLPAVSGSLPPVVKASLEAAHQAGAQVELLKAQFQEVFKASGVRISKVLHEVAGAEPFREAVTWQNRQALQSSIDVLLRMPADSQAEGTKRRRHEAVIATYLQRYCVKNDTIGFFGPVGWATLNNSERRVKLAVSPEPLAMRRVYFEDWCIEALVKKLNDDTKLRRWFAPRRLPFIYLDGDTLNVPMRRPIRLAAKHAAVLRRCNGEHTAGEIARLMLRGRAEGVGSEQEVFAILEGLRAQRLLVWQLEVPLDTYPERRLREALERIDEEGLRQAALAPLDELEQARDAVAAAAGDAAKLSIALSALDEKFTALTGEASTRAAGMTYAARTLVYEDCRRSTQLELGSALIQELAPPLGLLLKSARWFTYEAAGVLREALRGVYLELVKKNGGKRNVDGLSFWMQAQAQLFREMEGTRGLEAPVLDGMQEIFQQRWEEVLGITGEQRRLEWRTSDLRERVETAFAAPHAGWSFGRYNSPDIMIAAESAEAIERGDYQFVMGELHLGNNTLGGSLFVEQHPHPEELFAAIESDMPRTHAVPMTPKEWLTARINYILLSPENYRIEFTVNSFHRDRTKALPIAELVVEEKGRDLVARTLDGRFSFDLVEIFGGMFSGFVVNQFKLMRSLPRTPRVTIDRLIVARETWRFAADDISFAEVKDDAERFVAARRWARSQQLPRFVFVKVPVETKPFYVDFDSPAYVNLLGKMVRRTALEGGAGVSITVSEMVPGLEQVWLPDAEGERYTSELRIVAVDLAKIRGE